MHYRIAWQKINEMETRLGKMLAFWRIFVLGTAVFMLAACGSNESQVLRLATTTSTEDSGLLQAILPDFEAQFNVRVDVVAVGTGQAIALGEAGDADVILVHARSREDAFVADGHGTARADVMYNDFIIVGPADDPAGILGMELASEALTAIAGVEATFASRGDDSGTHSKERALWEAAGLPRDPEGGWYKSLGQGMGDTLRFANESGAYTMTDRGTFLSQQENLPNLAIMVGGNSIDENADLSLYNPYGVIPVNPNKGNVNNGLADDFVAWLTSIAVQSVIAEYGIDTFGQPLFYPDSQVWRDR
ncbi:substrate-binding domain-containing protein [Candidatus Leptofilum sp.]|uniref:substrate-binding domain-containing protein n=1 Tax=Candidatus Leptofilum sp. TaxID=3241576 RepID=UPI003B5B1749